MAEESKAAELSIAQTGPVVALATALFGAMGFLATRSYLNGLGVPEHAAIALDEYAQQGGRFFFTLAAQLLPVSACTLIVLQVCRMLVRRSAWLRRVTASGHFSCLVLAAIALATVVIELTCLPPDPVFAPGRILDVAGDLRSRLFLIDAGLVTTVALLSRWFDFLWLHYRDTFFKQFLVLTILLALLVEALLLPVCFGRTEIIPRSFARVSLLREKDQPTLSGILVFSGAESYFVFGDERKLTEVPHRTVREIRYESTEPLERLARQ